MHIPFHTKQQPTFFATSPHLTYPMTLRQVASYAVKDVEQYRNFCDRSGNERPQPNDFTTVSAPSLPTHKNLWGGHDPLPRN